MFQKLLRVTLLAVLCFAGSQRVWASSGQWQFDVFLNDKKVGTHQLVVAPQAQQTRVAIEAQFDIRFLFINAFSYDHRNEEVWRDGCLVELRSSTVQNGRQSQVSGQVRNEGFVVQSTDGVVALDGCIQSFAYWSPSIRQADALLNPQTGALEPVTFEAAGREDVAYQGRRIAAAMYDLRTEAQSIRLWYAEANDLWLALEAEVAGGRTLRYQPTRLPAPAHQEVAHARP